MIEEGRNPQSVEAGAEPRPGAQGSSGWRRVRDRFLTLFTRRMGEGGSHGFGDDHDARFLAALTDLEPADASGNLSAALWDLGHAAGTHVYGVHVVEDDLAEALAGLSHQVEATGLGVLEEVDRFHRSVDVELEPSREVANAFHGWVDAYVGGLLEGSIARGFNVNVHVETRDVHVFHMELQGGPEGPQELSHGR